MAHTQLPLSTLPLWQSLNNVVFNNTRLESIPGKGSGLVAGEAGIDNTNGSAGPLIAVPSDLVLSVEAVEQYAKQDRNFRELLDAVGRQNARGDILLFLFVQLVIGLGTSGESPAALPVPWTEYVKFLPDDVPLPTLWTDSERLLLQGTSLENAVEAKIVALEHEFDELREKSSDLPYWQAAFWEHKNPPQLRHWFLVDAWYRSRCLDLPRSGPSMVPCIDMVNHSAAPSAYYDEPAGGSQVVLLPAAGHVAANDEITISYTGGSTSTDSSVKPASEMLFSYGFVDRASALQSLVLPFRPLPDDPLAKAKMHISGGPNQRLEIQMEGSADEEGQENKVKWTCPFAYLSCVNEEDGLDFRLEQQNDGSTTLRMFWEDVDVTESAQDFASIISGHALAPVIQLRVVIVLLESLEAQMERMQAAGQAEDGDDDDENENEEDDDMDEGDDDVRSSVAHQAAILRDIESQILSSAIEVLEAERSDLLSHPAVLAYLEQTGEPQNTEDESMNEDFS